MKLEKINPVVDDVEGKVGTHGHLERKMRELRPGDGRDDDDRGD